MSSDTQISATISTATKERFDQFTENRGLKKNFVVEQALIFFMDARREWPDEAFIPSRIVLDEASFDRLVEATSNPPQPTDALRELMRGHKP